MEQMLHGKSKGAAFFRKLRGEAKISLLIVASISSQIILYTASG